MFLVPLDRRREWYRYHALFREFLLGELRRVEPDVIEKLHLRAADWYQSNGSPAMAVEHLLNTTERHRCVQLVTELVLPTYQMGQMSTVQRWLSAIGDSAIEDYPPLAVLAGWTTVLTGQTAEAEHWAAIVDAASFDLVPLDGSASFDSARAMLRAVMCRRRSGADDGRRELRGGPGAAVEPVARRRASCCAPRRICSPATSTGRLRCSRSRPRWRSRCPIPIPSSSASRGWQCWRWIAGAGRRRPSTWNARSMPSRASDARLRHQPARLRRRGPARHTPRRRDGGGPPTRARDAGPPLLHVRDAVPRRAPTTAPGQGLPRQRRRDDRPSSAEGDRRHPGHTAPTSARSSTRSTSSARSSPRARKREQPAGAPLSPGGASPAPLPADTPHDPRDRRAAVRLPQHRQLRDRLDLPETGRLLTQRRRATGDGRRPARRIAGG